MYVAPFIASESGSLRDLEYILWEVRFTVLMQLYHWKARHTGLWTVQPQKPAAERAAQLFDRHESTKRQIQN